jgi:uncharacterized protein YggL (DUF469 family)
MERVSLPASIVMAAGLEFGFSKIGGCILVAFFDRQRSRRLRKKLRVAEFQEFGFHVKIDLATELSREGEEAFIDGLLTLVEPRALGYGGWVRGGFIISVVRGSATEQDREDVRKWLEARPEVSGVDVGPLEDAWYGCEDCTQEHSC